MKTPERQITSKENLPLYSPTHKLYNLWTRKLSKIKWTSMEKIPIQLQKIPNHLQDHLTPQIWENKWLNSTLNRILWSKVSLKEQRRKLKEVTDWYKINWWLNNKNLKCVSNKEAEVKNKEVSKRDNDSKDQPKEQITKKWDICLLLIKLININSDVYRIFTFNFGRSIDWNKIL